MERISQRDLRNDNAEIMRRVEAGESFTVTRNGQPVADLVPHQSGRPEKRTWVPTAEIVEALSGLRGWTYEDYMKERAEMDALYDDELEPDPWTRNQ